MTRSKEDRHRPDPNVGRLLDRHLGQRLARRRLELECPAADLDAVLNVPPGTVLRFGSGVKSMNAGQLVALGRALRVPVSYFFEGLPDLPLPAPADLPNADRVAETAQFIDAYYRITDAGLRRDILGLLKAAAGE